MNKKIEKICVLFAGCSCLLFGWLEIVRGEYALSIVSFIGSFMYFSYYRAMLWGIKCTRKN